MTKYARITGKVFGSSATATGNDPEIGQFGSALAGTYNGTTDVATIQSLPAWQSGFIGAVTPNTQFPPLPEMTGFGKVLSQQICYLLQQGVAEYDSGTTYYIGNWVSYNSSLYVAKVDNFSNVLPTDTTKWNKFTGGSSRNLGEYVTSSLPLTDTTLHLADGALLTQSDYPELYSYISSIYVNPTTVNYYAWTAFISKQYVQFYTLSATPSTGNKVYEYRRGDFIEVGTVISTYGYSITVSVYGSTEMASRDTNYDTSHLTYQGGFTSEENWEAEYTTYGECGKYVFNSGANTVRIPLVNSYFTNTVNSQALGNLIPASLPNIKGSGILNDDTSFCSGALYDSGSVSTTNSEPGGNSSKLVKFDASRSNSIYSDTATTVNTQSIKQLVYIVVKK